MMLRLASFQLSIVAASAASSLRPDLYDTIAQFAGPAFTYASRDTYRIRSRTATDALNSFEAELRNMLAQDGAILQLDPATLRVSEPQAPSHKAHLREWQATWGVNVDLLKTQFSVGANNDVHTKFFASWLREHEAVWTMDRPLLERGWALWRDFSKYLQERKVDVLMVNLGVTDLAKWWVDNMFGHSHLEGQSSLNPLSLLDDEWYLVSEDIHLGEERDFLTYYARHLELASLQRHLEGARAQGNREGAPLLTLNRKLQDLASLMASPIGGGSDDAEAGGEEQTELDEAAEDASQTLSRPPTTGVSGAVSTAPSGAMLGDQAPVSGDQETQAAAVSILANLEETQAAAVPIGQLREGLLKKVAGGD